MDGDVPMNRKQITLPLVEIFQTVEGEGGKAGYPTTFIRIYNCNLRCTWCDTPYSYAPHPPEMTATVGEILEQVERYGNRHICLTGGEPLLYRDKALALLQELAPLPFLEDIHIETNGAIDLLPFHRWRESSPHGEKIRFIMDFKLLSSGERNKMILGNFLHLTDRDEIKFVISDREAFDEALSVVNRHVRRGQILFSPEWNSLPPDQLVDWLLQSELKDIRLNLQTHKYIWDPDRRGV
jgi:7-carboxy-7-deazaguanine synthase